MDQDAYDDGDDKNRGYVSDGDGDADDKNND